MNINRWEWLEGLKPESSIAVAVKFLAGMIADELIEWPPDVRLQDAGSSKFSEVLAPGATRPSLAAFKQAIRRAQWELERNFEAIDHFERNHQLEMHCPAKRDQIASEFIQHYILESYFGLMERTEYRVKRQDVIHGVSLLEQRILAKWPGIVTLN